LTPQGFALYNGRLSPLWFRVKILDKQKPAKAVALRVFELQTVFMQVSQPLSQTSLVT
jgi:hypothetical protein